MRPGTAIRRLWVAAVAGTLAAVGGGGEIDWQQAVVDPAARPAWVSATVVIVGGERTPLRAVDAPTGGVRPPTDEEMERLENLRRERPRRRGRRPHDRGADPGPEADTPPLPPAAAALSGPHAWAPGFGHVVAWEVEPAQSHPVHVIESSPPDRIEPRLLTREYLKPGDRIERRWPRLFTRDGVEVPIDRELFSNPWSIDRLRWATDGRSFTFLFNQRGHQVLRLIAIDAATGTPRVVVEESSDTFIDYAHKTWCHWLSEGQLLWMSERSGWNHVWLVDVATAGDGTHELLWSPDGRWYVDT